MQMPQSQETDKQPFNALKLITKNTPFDSTKSNAHNDQNRGNT
jgi:hypothetical protein